MSEHASVSMPENLAYAGFYALGLYPQTSTGTNLLGGEVLINDVLNGELKWQDVPNITASDEQVDVFLNGANKFHNNYKSPCTSGQAEDVRSHVFVRGRVAAIAAGWIRSGVPSVAAHYAHALLPDETPEMLLPVSEDMRERDKRVASVLWESPGKGSEPRPEALALGGLWTAGANVLRAKPALTVAMGYRTVLSAMYGPEVTLDEWHDYRSELFEAGDKLRDLVREGVFAALPGIAEQTGYSVPVDAAKVFVKHSTASIKTTPTERIRQLMEDELEVVG